VTYDTYGAVEDKSPLPQRKSSELFLGHRCWRLTKDEDGQATLMSYAAPYLWDGPIVRTDDDPETQDLIGFNAFSGPLPEDFEGLLGNDPMYSVVGELELFGKVVVHEKGYRATKARIKRLIISNGGWAENHILSGGISSPGTLFCKCSKTNPPWKDRPWEEARAQLEQKYDCDVEYRPTGGAEECYYSNSNWYIIDDPITPTTSFIHKPTLEDMTWISDNQKKWSPSSQQRSISLGHIVDPSQVGKSLLLLPENAREKKSWSPSVPTTPLTEAEILSMSQTGIFNQQRTTDLVKDLKYSIQYMNFSVQPTPHTASSIAATMSAEKKRFNKKINDMLLNILKAP